ncbi:hypothetical protein V8B55DRAFT_1580227 [Mucor lusitanicus]|uniref:GATA-type domain-containing protein n=1 Tax=Mucor circinelloides f. lusitanicus TaxID=29924 RepID=A0A8H4BEY5_MUCCL|nr:hypothetical protein FB192DRAFT_1460550 [Mucor lusitanicus]
MSTTTTSTVDRSVANTKMARHYFANMFEFHHYHKFYYHSYGVLDTAIISLGSRFSVEARFYEVWFGSRETPRRDWRYERTIFCIERKDITQSGFNKKIEHFVLPAEAMVDMSSDISQKRESVVSFHFDRKTVEFPDNELCKELKVYNFEKPSIGYSRGYDGVVSYVASLRISENTGGLSGIQNALRRMNDNFQYSNRCMMGVRSMHRSTTQNQENTAPQMVEPVAAIEPPNPAYSNKIKPFLPAKSVEPKAPSSAKPAAPKASSSAKPANPKASSSAKSAKPKVSSTAKPAEPKASLPAKSSNPKASSTAKSANPKVPSPAKSSPESTNSTNSDKECSYCARKTTPMWRRGPAGPGTLCNACGINWSHGKILCDGNSTMEAVASTSTAATTENEDSLNDTKSNNTGAKRKHTKSAETSQPTKKQKKKVVAGESMVIGLTQDEGSFGSLHSLGLNTVFADEEGLDSLGLDAAEVATTLTLINKSRFIQ